MSNDGSYNNPWSTLQAVFDNGKIGNPVVGGDTILCRTGYHGEINYSGSINSDYITVEAQQGHIPRLKRITLRSGGRWIFRGLTISPELAPIYEAGKTFYAENTDYITIENCNLYSKLDSSAWTLNDWQRFVGNNQSSGIHLRGSCRYVTIRNNTLRNVYSGIIVDCSNALVEDNVIENFAADGLVGNGNDQVWQYNVVMNSVNINSNHDDLLQIAPGPNYRIEIRGNILISGPDPGNPLLHGAQGIGLWDGPNYNIIIENNIVMNDHGGHGIKCSDCQDSIIINNIAVNHPYGSSAPEIGTPSKGRGGNNNVTIRNNIAHGIGWEGTNIVVDHNLDVDNYNWDELFVDWANYNLRPVAGSPAIDAGTPLLAPNIDIDGTSRPQGVEYDIGAYEYTVSQPGAPVLDSIGDKSIGEDELLTFTINATDPDGDPITYSIQGKPVGATFANQTFSWTPTHSEAGQYDNVTFIADDGEFQDSETITITAGYAPILDSIGNKSVDENTTLTFTINATDADGNLITYSTGSLPNGAKFDTNTATFDWTPAYGQAGSYSVTFSATDDIYTDSETISITINPADEDGDGLPDA
ncbi:hypothetical protein DRN85_09115, partial [Methanosarcinales archaeon]